MSRHRKEGVPAWLPFGLVASFLIAIGAGARSGWKTSADQAPPSPPPPPPPEQGALQDWFGGNYLS